MTQYVDWDYKGDWSLPVGYYGRVPRRTNCLQLINNTCGNSYFDDEWSEGGFGGQRYIVYKVQNANNSASTPLTLQAVGNDGITLIGTAVTLLDIEAEDSGSIEAPSIYKTPGNVYVLTFSKGNTATPEYTVSYAVAANVTGPYIRKGDLLKTGDCNLNGPGGADINFNGERMVFHAMGQSIGCEYEGLRVFHAADIEVDDTTGEMRLKAL